MPEQLGERVATLFATQCCRGSGGHRDKRVAALSMADELTNFEVRNRDANQAIHGPGRALLDHPRRWRGIRGDGRDRRSGRRVSSPPNRDGLSRRCASRRCKDRVHPRKQAPFGKADRSECSLRPAPIAMARMARTRAAGHARAVADLGCTGSGGLNPRSPFRQLCQGRLQGL